MVSRILASFLILATPCLCAEVEEKAADKSHYHLFNPTPRDQMREMSTDRPDLTESPFTVDAGHFQLEMDLFNYTYDRHTVSGDHVTVNSYSIAPLNLKAGLLNNVDLQLMIESYVHGRTFDRQTRDVQRQSGFGDVTTRLKVNCWGNDGGTTALAVMPFVKFPTSQDNIGNDHVEGGFIVPLSVSLPAGWDSTMMTELDILRDGDNAGYHAEFVNTITFSHEIYGSLGGYVEFFSLVDTDGGEWIGTVDGGLTYAVTPDIQLDAGINVGVTRSAPDINPFVGFSVRF